MMRRRSSSRCSRKLMLPISRRPGSGGEAGPTSTSGIVLLFGGHRVSVRGSGLAGKRRRSTGGSPRKRIVVHNHAFKDGVLWGRRDCGRGGAILFHLDVA